MRLGKVFFKVFAEVQGVSLIGLGIIGHRLDLFVGLQLWLAPIAGLVAGLVVAAIVLEERGVTLPKLSRPRVPEVDSRALSERIGGPAVAAVSRARQRRDGPITGTNRP